jgi:cytochrome c-type biogenesis protein CcmE
MRLRSLVIPAVGIGAVLAGALAFGGINGDLVYYLTPTEAVERHAAFPDDRRFRLAGNVAAGTVTTADDGVTFTVTDDATTVDVVHAGAPPQLFQEGIDVVLEGSWRGATFVSDTMLIKHDEEYYPPEDDRAGGAA